MSISDFLEKWDDTIITVVLSFLAIYIIFVANKKTNNAKQKDTYMSEGMAIGMAVGAAIGSAIDAIGTAEGIIIGMILGMSIGMSKIKE